MARLPRLDVPGIPQHLVQRGNNRSACFFDDQDYFAYLDSCAKARGSLIATSMPMC